MSVPTALVLRRHKRTSSTLSTSTKNSPVLPIAASFKRPRINTVEAAATAITDDIKTTTLEYPRWQHEGLASDVRTPPSSAPYSARTLGSSNDSSEEDDESGTSSGTGSASDGELEDDRTIVEEEDYTSSSSSSSSSGSESEFEVESESELEAVIEQRDAEEAAELVSSVPSGSRPAIVSVGHSELAARLSSFLPSMATANEELDLERAEGKLEERNVEKVTDGKSYIEMNLGLGIFEERCDENSSDAENEAEDEADGKNISDVLGRLMGRPKETDIKPGIVVVGEEIDSRN